MEDRISELENRKLEMNQEREITFLNVKKSYESYQTPLEKPTKE